MDRRNMMTMMAGLGFLAATMPAAQAHASPANRAPLPTQPPTADPGTYIFHDEFDGPAGSAPDPSKWLIQTWQDDVYPPVAGIYRDDRRNIFQDGNSNLVMMATHDMNMYYGAKLRGIWRGMINQTWEARIKLDCLTPGAWPAFWAVNEDPLPDGEVDIFEWYGNDAWAPGTTVHAASNGKTWEGKSIPGMVDNAWHTWRMHWGEDGFSFWRDWVDGADPYFHVPPTPIQVSGRPGDLRWPFSIPGYWMQPMFTLAVGGPGGGDPARGQFPASMLVDYLRVW